MTLNLHPEGSSASKSKKYKKALAVGGAVSLAGLGSTFAANISLNQGNNVEFGQGLAQTAACDSDGFNVTPVSSYDNAHSVFRVDRVQITGLNLTAVGFGWDDADLNNAYADQNAAKLAHPGQYYDTDANAWKRTCDGVVLDFKAFTDEAQYGPFTADGYYNFSTTDTSTALNWVQFNGLAPTGYQDVANPGYAIKLTQSQYSIGELDYVDQVAWPTNNRHIYLNNYGWDSTPSNSYFDFSFDSNWRPNASAISKITVASMSQFPSNYGDEYSYTWN